MKISYRWLKRYLEVNLSPERVAEILTDTGLEVEGVAEVESIKGGLRGVVIGKVLTCEQHPNADRLKVTTVDVGAEAPLQIVCGAPNVAAGQTVPVALVGTTLYPNGEELKLKKGKIRGEESMGMICAEDELGLGQSHDGILVLEDSWAAGTPCAEVFNMESDFVFEIGLTPNRTDAMGHIGVARDLRAALITAGEEAPLLTVPAPSFNASTTNPITLTVEDAGCPAYYGAYLTDITVKESPEWLKNSLVAIGLTPKNNVVDITNYVMHTYGHPLHAFDADAIDGNAVIVRSAKAGEKLVTLDDVERELDTADMIIADANGPMCIAGVLGGKTSGVSDSTKNVYLEGAYFDAVRVRKTAKRHAINSDASYRYERGVDPNSTAQAHAYAIALLIEHADAKVSDVDLVGTSEFPCQEVSFSFSKVMQLIGLELSTEMVDLILKQLDFKIIAMNGDTWHVAVPTYRVDVTRDVDIAEEILRIYGFNKVEVPAQMRISVAPHDPRPEKLEKSILNQLTGNGFFEIMNNSLAKGEDYEVLQPEVRANLVEMLNPLSMDLNVMRANLLFGGLQAISFNQKRQQPNLRLFERGKTYGRGGNGYFENTQLDLFAAGNFGEDHWNTQAQSNNYFWLKGLMESLLTRMGLNVEFKAGSHSLYGEYVEIKLGKSSIGALGTVHPKVLKHFDIKGGVVHASLDWARCNDAVLSQGAKLFESLPKFPSVRRDLALLVDRSEAYANLEQIITQTGKGLLTHSFLFDVYEGDKLPADKKSYAIGMIFQDPNKTLNDKAVDKTVARIVEQLNKRAGAVLRQ